MKKNIMKRTKVSSRSDYKIFLKGETTPILSNLKMNHFICQLYLKKTGRKLRSGDDNWIKTSDVMESYEFYAFSKLKLSKTPFAWVSQQDHSSTLLLPQHYDEVMNDEVEKTDSPTATLS